MAEPKQNLFNYDKFVERVFGNEALAQRIGRAALQDYEHNLEGLRYSIKSQDESEMLFFLHGIKGVAGNAHCDALFHLSKRLEHAVKAGELATNSEDLDELITLTQRSAEAMRSYLVEAN